MGLFDNFTGFKWNGNSNNALGKSIDNYVNSDNNFDADSLQANNNSKWKDAGLAALQGFGNIGGGFSQGGGQSVMFNPVMAQPQYLNTQFNTNPSTIANSGLYNNLMR